MKDYRTKFKEYLDDLGARQPSPGGGSAVCVVFCIGLSLIEMAMRYSEKQEENIKEVKKLRKQVYPYIDLDSKIFDKIMRAHDPRKKLEYIKDSEKLIIYLGMACHQAFLLAKKAESGIKDSIISDFYIGLDCVKVTLRGCVFNLEANSKIFGKKTKYINIFDNYLEKWDES